MAWSDEYPGMCRYKPHSAIVMTTVCDVFLQHKLWQRNRWAADRFRMLGQQHLAGDFLDKEQTMPGMQCRSPVTLVCCL